MNVHFLQALCCLFFLVMTSCSLRSSDQSTEFYFDHAWGNQEVRIVPISFDERKFVVGQLETMEKIDVLLLGSSRLFEADSDMFRQDVHIFNAAISVGVIQDFAAIWQSMKNQSKSAKFFLISLDPWVFNKNNRRNEWRSNENLYDQFLRQSTRTPWEKFRDFFSEYGKTPNDWPIIKESEMKPDQRGKRGDGSFAFEQWSQHPVEPQDLQRKVQQYMEGCIYSLCDWQFDEDQYQVLVRVLREIHEQDGKTLLILPPYHPTVYRKLYYHKDAYQGILQNVEQTVTERLHNEPGLVFDICNGLNPAVVGCTGAEFTDGMHYHRSCTQKIIQSCVGKFMDGLLH